MMIDAPIVSAVTEHMNGDHADDSLLIARAFGYPQAAAAVMVSLDAHRGFWRVTDAEGEHDLALDWPGGEVTERPQIRRSVVALYRQACERLGVPAREEHPAPAHLHAAAGTAAHGSPHGPASHSSPHAAPQGDGFAHRIRTATWSDHGDSEGATFMTDLMRGKGTRDDYADLVAQHWFMYEALEAATGQLLDRPELLALHPEALWRMAALERDLQHLLGDGWRQRITAVPATTAYADRIREVAAEGWIAGIVAHHYTRYLGDLSGGQAIARRMARQFGFVGAGIDFYDFTDLGDLDAFKNGYRRVLDALGATLDEQEQQRMLDEVRAAYHHNTAVFVDLGRERAAA